MNKWCEERWIRDKTRKKNVTRLLLKRPMLALNYGWQQKMQGDKLHCCERIRLMGHIQAIKTPCSYGDVIRRKPHSVELDWTAQRRSRVYPQRNSLATVVKDDDFEENSPWKIWRVSIDTKEKRPCYELVLEYPAIGEPGAVQADAGHMQNHGKATAAFNIMKWL